MWRTLFLPALIGISTLTLPGGATAVTLTPSIDFQTQGNASGVTNGQTGGAGLNFRFQQTPRVDNRFGMEFALAAVPASNVVASATWRGTPASVTGSNSLLQFNAYSGNGTFQLSDTYEETSPVGQLAGVVAGIEQSIEFDPGYLTSLVGSATYFGINARERTNNTLGTFASRTTATPPKLDLELIDPLAANSNRFLASGTQPWNVDGNWSLGTPIVSDDVFIRPTVASIVHGLVGQVEVNSFTVGGDGSAPAEFVVSGGVEFTSHGITTLGSGGTLQLGSGAFRTGGLNTAPGGTINWGTNGFLAIDVGYLSTPIGDFVVDGADMPILAMAGGKMRKVSSTETATDRLVIGDDESGFMIVSGQSDVEARLVRLGNQSSGFGKVHVGETGAVFKPSTLLEVGPIGRGELTVSLGGRMEAGLVFVGSTLEGAIDNDDVDRLTITGPGTTAKIASIEASGRSIVEIRDGAIVEGSGIGGAGDSAQPPVFRVTGPGTRLTLTDVIRTGSTLTANGSSHVIVENGARVDAKNIQLALASEDVGFSNCQMTINGAGSQVNTTSTVILGGINNGNSLLNVVNGGVLRAGGATSLAFSLAANPGATTSMVFVSGAGSRWEQTGEIFIGGTRDLSNQLVDLGSATVHVAADGTLDASTAVNVMLRGVLILSGGRIEAPLVRNNRGGFFHFTGGTLAVGQFDGDLVQQGGTLVAGSSPGTMSINGDYTLDDDGILEVELAGNSTPGTGYDQYVVSGDASLTGKLKVVLLNGFLPTLGDSFQFLMAQGSLTNMLDLSLLPDLSVDLDWQLTTVPHGLSLNVVSATLDGDFNHDNVVDAADYTVWRNGLGTVYFPNDYALWKSHFGERRTPGAGSLQPTANVPEPNSFALFLAIAGLGSLFKVRISRR
jgi:T5SS/PEP-CTERM-associated repeat protein